MVTTFSAAAAGATLCPMVSVGPGRTVWRFVRSAPLTFAWLALLLLTTLRQHALGPAQLHAVIEKHSTNLHHLATDPVRVLLDSLLWIDGIWWWPYLLMYCAVLVPAERWLGSLRWLVVGLIAHVVATYAGEGALYWAIQQAEVSPRMIEARDVGVSYFLAGMMGVLTYRFAGVSRWIYVTGTVALFGVLLAVDPDFTAIGHFTAVLVGLACYPLTLGRHPVLWDPVRRLRSRGLDRHRHRPSGAVRGTGPGGAGQR